MAAGIATPGNYIFKEWKSLAMLLGPVMVSMWLITSIGFKFILDLNWQTAFIIGACITPTDPVLANSIVQGFFAENYVSLQLRLLISAESAINDGLGSAILLLPVYLTEIADKGVAIGKWFVIGVLYQVGLSVLIGVVIGIILLQTLRFSQKNNLIGQESFLTFSIAFAVYLV